MHLTDTLRQAWTGEMLRGHKYLRVETSSQQSGIANDYR
jgi:hypothetical protein